MTPEKSREIADFLTPETLYDSLCPHGLMGLGVLHDRGIRNAITNGWITIPQSLNPEQFQSNTLDVRVGDVYIYNNQFEQLPSHKDIPIDILPQETARIYLHEDICSEYFMYPVLKSGRGRLGLRMIGEGRLNSENGPYVDVKNTTKSIIRLYGQDAFAQLLFHGTPPDGYVVRNSCEARECAKIMSPQLETVYGYALLRLGSWIAKLRDDVEVIDTRNAKFDDLFIKEQSKDSYTLYSGNHYVAQLIPKLQMPANMSMLILPYIPMDGRAFIPLDTPTCNAGFVDSGYCLGNPGNVTGHLAPQEDVCIYPGQTIALGLIYNHVTPVDRLYGSPALKSHHNNSDGSTLSVNK